MLPSISNTTTTQRKSATYYRLHLGKNQTQKLEKSAQSSPTPIKTLHLVDFLIKYGPTSLIDNFKENVYEFRKLDDYTNMSDGIDRGESGMSFNTK